MRTPALAVLALLAFALSPFSPALGQAAAPAPAFSPPSLTPDKNPGNLDGVTIIKKYTDAYGKCIVLPAYQTSAAAFAGCINQYIDLQKKPGDPLLTMQLAPPAPAPPS